MKKILTLIVAASLLLVSCEGHEQKTVESDQPSDQGEPKEYNETERRDGYRVPSDRPSFINKDSANRMIGSYLSSIPAPEQNASLASLIINADSLRTYLNDTSLHIKNIKIMLAHTPTYINTGHYGQYCGYRSGQLTTVICGYNAEGDYVFWGGDAVMDNCMPCPNNCPPSGTAQSNLFSPILN